MSKKFDAAKIKYRSAKEVAESLKGHKSFAVSSYEGKKADGTKVEKWRVKNLFRTSILGHRMIRARVPANMSWDADQIGIVQHAAKQAAVDVLQTALEARKNGTFSRATFMDRPPLTDEEKKERDADHKKRSAAWAKRLADAADKKKKREAAAVIRKAKREAKIDADLKKLEAKKKALQPTA